MSSYFSFPSSDAWAKFHLSEPGADEPGCGTWHPDSGRGSQPAVDEPGCPPWPPDSNRGSQPGVDEPHPGESATKPQ